MARRSTARAARRRRSPPGRHSSRNAPACRRRRRPGWTGPPPGSVPSAATTPPRRAGRRGPRAMRGEGEGVAQAGGVRLGDVGCSMARLKHGLTRSATAAPAGRAAPARCRYSRTPASAARSPATAAPGCPAGTPTPPRMTKRTTAQDAAEPAAAASRPATSPSSPNSTSQARADLGPRGADRLQHHRVPHPRAAARPPPRRPAPACPASSVTEEVARSATPTRASSPATASSASRTRMPETLGKASVSARSTPALGLRACAHGRDVRVRRGLQQAGGGDHDVVDAEPPPLDLAQRGDPQVDVAAQHVDGDDVEPMPDAPAARPARRRRRPAAGRRSRPATTGPATSRVPSGGVAA